MPRTSGLNVGSFILQSGDFLALAQEGSIGSQLDTSDLRGIADRYEWPQQMKAGNSMDFTVLMYKSGSGTLRASGLDVSVWSIGGTDYLADVTQGTISVTTPTEDAEGIAVFDKVPNVVGGQAIEITTKKLISTSTNLADMTRLAFTSSTPGAGGLDVAVSIGFAGTSFMCPATLTAAKHTFSRGKLQMEDVTIKLKGVPTAPLSNTGLLGQCILGDSTCTIAVNSGANTYVANSSNSLTSIITKLSVEFAKGQEIKTTGTLVIQGAPGVS